MNFTNDVALELKLDIAIKGQILIVFTLWLGCCLFDIFPISILNIITCINNLFVSDLHNFDFLQVHVRDMAQIADHCRSYALSDIDSNFRNDCKHEHTLCCTQCLLLESFMDDVLVKVNNKEWDHTDQVMFKVKKKMMDLSVQTKIRNMISIYN